MKIENIRIQMTMTSLSGKEWVKVLKDDRDFKNQFLWDYDITLDFINYVEETCGGWEKYVRRIHGYGDGYDFIKELYYDGGLGKDNIYYFVSNHNKDFGLYMKHMNDYILKVLKEHNSSIIDFKDIWFNKNSDVFIEFCCKFIGYITNKLLNFADVEYILSKEF